MKKIYLEKSYTKCGREICPRAFYKESKLSISLDQQSEIFRMILKEKYFLQYTLLTGQISLPDCL